MDEIEWTMARKLGLEEFEKSIVFGTLLLLGYLERQTKPNEITDFKVCWCYTCLCLNRFICF